MNNENKGYKMKGFYTSYLYYAEYEQAYEKRVCRIPRKSEYDVGNRSAHVAENKSARGKTKERENGRYNKDHSQRFVTASDPLFFFSFRISFWRQNGTPLEFSLP